MATDVGVTTSPIRSSHATDTRARSANGDGRDVSARPERGSGVSGSTAVQAPPFDRQTLEKSVALVQEHIQAVHRSIRFEVDDATGRTLVKVVDPESGDLIRQLPPENILATAKALAEMAEQGEQPPVSGLLLEAEA